MRRSVSLITAIIFMSVTALFVSAASYTYTNSTAVAIPDGTGVANCADDTPQSVISTIDVPDPVVIDDLNVALNISHTWAGDLVVELTSPAGTTITLVDRVGRPSPSSCGYSNNNIITTLDDESSGGPVENADPPTGPSYTPEQALSAFDGQNAQGTWTLTVSDTVRFDVGTLNSWSLIIEDSEAAATAIESDDDPDDDGISSGRDNCPYDYNPDQEDGWGSAAGDLCDTDWYNQVGIGITGFPQKNGLFHLHGNCTYMADGAPRCPVIAAFDPASFTPDAMPLHVETAEAGVWSVVVHYLHSNHGYAVYQVNVYSTNPPQPDMLLDDRLELHVYGGSWRWHMRGGSSRYQGDVYTSGAASDGKAK